jgi:protein TonB
MPRQAAFCHKSGQILMQANNLIEYDCYLHLKSGHHFSTETTMSAMTLDLPRRFPWPTLLSVAIHGGVVAALLYTSVHQVIERPSPSQPIEITMVPGRSGTASGGSAGR